MPDPNSNRAGADRNLLFGILALQMDFITRDALIAAMHAWVLDKAMPLGQILVKLNALTEARHAMLEPLVDEHVKAHGGDAQQSMAALSSVSWIRKALADVNDAGVQHSLAAAGAITPANPESTIDLPKFAGLRYRVLRPHAKGGLGEVHVAEDQELHREVALKEIRTERAHDPVSRGRFLLEAEVTGRLEHPGIVPVYGLGTYADGRPFYAMRFIRGDNLKEAIARFHDAEVPNRDPGERSLAFRQLLRRFIDVCNAVAYAHSRGVLHRDLKPGNVMLGKYGETLLVDWGLAKTVGRPDPPSDGDESTIYPLSGSSVVETHAGVAMGTPAFMSPEQAAGKLDELGPASDVYSLGATLYMVLTGRPPFVGENAGAVLAMVQLGEFTTPRQVKNGTPPALDAICRTAMALKPADRYSTALDVAADVEHWLADEPVAAYPDSWYVRRRRWVKRHRTLVTGIVVLSASALVASLIAVGLLARANVEITKAKDEAEQSRDAAKRVTQFMTDEFLAVARPEEKGREITIKQALDAAAPKIDSAFAGQMELEAEVRNTVGYTYHQLGYYPLAESHFRKALDLRSVQFGHDHRETLTAMNNLATALSAQGKWAEAEPMVRLHLAACQREFGGEDPTTLRAVSQMAHLLWKQGKGAAAEPLLRENLSASLRMFGAEDSRALGAMSSLARVLQDQGKLTEAELLYRESVAAYRQARRLDEAAFTASQNLADLLIVLGKPIEAEQLSRELLETARRSWGPEHATTLRVLNGLALSLRDQRKLNEAELLLREAINGMRRALRPDHPEIFAVVDNLTRVLRDQGNLDQAEDLSRRNLEACRHALGPDDIRTHGRAHNLANLLHDRGNFAEAEPVYRRTIEAYRRAYGDHRATLMAQSNLASVLKDQGRWKEAEPICRDALSRRRQVLPGDHPDISDSLILLGDGLIECERAEEAEPILREGLAIRRSRLPQGDWRIAQAEILLGACLANGKANTEAETLLISGHAILLTNEKRLSASAKRNLAEGLERLIRLYESWPKPDKAAEWRAKRDEIMQAAERMERLRLAVGIIAGWPLAR